MREIDERRAAVAKAPGSPPVDPRSRSAIANASRAIANRLLRPLAGLLRGSEASEQARPQRRVSLGHHGERVLQQPDQCRIDPCDPEDRSVREGGLGDELGDLGPAREGARFGDHAQPRLGCPRARCARARVRSTRARGGHDPARPARPCASCRWASGILERVGLEGTPRRVEQRIEGVLAIVGTGVAEVVRGHGGLGVGPTREVLADPSMDQRAARLRRALRRQSSSSACPSNA